MQNYYIWTIGCQMNKADSERLESAMGQIGLAASQSPQDADVIVLNSCVVRQSAEDRVVGMLGMLKPIKQQDPDKVIALMGCMVGPKTEALEKRFPQVDVFMRPQQFAPVLDLLQRGETILESVARIVGRELREPCLRALFRGIYAESSSRLVGQDVLDQLSIVELGRDQNLSGEM